MGVDGVGDLAEGHVEHDIGGLAADAGQALELRRASRGTSLPNSAISFSHSAMTFFALVRNRPIVLMRSRTLSSPSASIASGVSASAKSGRVALLTPASVACAESTTATSRVKGLTCSSSPFGSGLAWPEAA